MKSLVLIFTFFTGIVHITWSQDLFEERIWKIPGRKKSVFLDKGIFHLKTDQKKSKLVKIRHSYQKDQGIERIVIDFTTAQVPTIYGIYNRNNKKIQIDFSETEMDGKNQLDLSSSVFIKALDFFPIDSKILSLEITLNSQVNMDVFYLESPGRLVFDLKK